MLNVILWILRLYFWILINNILIVGVDNRIDWFYYIWFYLRVIFDVLRILDVIIRVLRIIGIVRIINKIIVRIINRIIIIGINRFYFWVLRFYSRIIIVIFLIIGFRNNYFRVVRFNLRYIIARKVVKVVVDIVIDILILGVNIVARLNNSNGTISLYRYNILCFYHSFLRCIYLITHI